MLLPNRPPIPVGGMTAQRGLCNCNPMVMVRLLIGVWLQNDAVQAAHIYVPVLLIVTLGIQNGLRWL